MQKPDFSRNPRLDLALNPRIPYYAIGLVILLWLLSGIYIVGPDEQGVIRRLGKWVDVTGPGPHWHLPFPIERVSTPKVTQVRRIEIGFRIVHPGPPARYRDRPEESLMLTGDENIVDAQIIVQYKIKDAAKYLFNVREPEELARDAAEAALRQVVGRHKIDEVLTENKALIEDETREKLQALLDLHESGLGVNLVKFQTVRPPAEVDAAFKDVASAREDKERLIQEAEAYRNDIIPKARGTAEKQIRDAEAYKIERIKRAQGETDRFQSVLKEYQKAKGVTETRLYLETMENILPGLRKYVVKADGNSGFLNVLPLEGGRIQSLPLPGKGGME